MKPGAVRQTAKYTGTKNRQAETHHTNYRRMRGTLRESIAMPQVARRMLRVPRCRPLIYLRRREWVLLLSSAHAP